MRMAILSTWTLATWPFWPTTSIRASCRSILGGNQASISSDLGPSCPFITSIGYIHCIATRVWMVASLTSSRYACARDRRSNYLLLWIPWGHSSRHLYKRGFSVLEACSLAVVRPLPSARTFLFFWCWVHCWFLFLFGRSWNMTDFWNSWCHWSWWIFLKPACVS